MATPSQRLAELGLSLPPVAKPIAAYIPARIIGALIVTSGQLPSVAGKLTVVGRVSMEVTPEQAKEAAALAALNALAAAADVAGGLDRIRSIVRVGVFVAAPPEFHTHSAVANGASELLEKVFGDAGKHVRAAVGCASLPMNAPVEVELTVELGA